MCAQLLLLLVLIAAGNAEVLRTSRIVNYEMGGSQITFTLNGLEINETDNLQCVLRFHDGRNATRIDATLIRHGQSAICRLPPEIVAGSVDVDLVVTTTSTYSALLAQTVFVDPAPIYSMSVVEDWITNQLSLTWFPEHFAQFYDPGENIKLILYVYAANSFEPIFKELFNETVGKNLGSATITLSPENVASLSNQLYPYFYILLPLGATLDKNAASSIFVPTLGMNESSAQRTCSNWLNIAKVPSTAEIHSCPPCLCQAVLDANFMQSEYPPQIVELTDGALNDYVLYYERVPTQSGYAQTCSYNTLTGNLANTSPAQAAWIQYVSKQASPLDNFLTDIWPYIVCCLQSGRQDYCDLFHEKRPIDTGHEYPGPEVPCIGWGDPHMETFESIKYSFMGYGEFWLVHGPEGSKIGVQGRMAPNKAISEIVTYYSAVAVRDGNTTVQIEMRAGVLLVFLNKRELQFSTLPVSLPLDSVLIIIDSNRVEVRMQSGFSIIVVGQSYVIDGIFFAYIDVYGSGAHYNKGKGFMGIFGNFDNDPQNDLTSRDGVVIPPTAENIGDVNLIHNEFGLTWLVKETESFFVYEDGKSWKDHANVEFIPMAQHPDPATLPDEVIAVCGDSLFCLIEYVGTGSLERAAEVARVESAFGDLRGEMTRTVPICDILVPPAHARVQVSGHLDGASANYTCNTEYDFGSGDRVRTCSASETFSQWTGEEPVCIWTCITCTENMPDIVTHDPSNCSKFLECVKGEWESYNCPHSQTFDPKIGSCSDVHICIDPPGC